jgi:uncharacterized protein
MTLLRRLGRALRRLRLPALLLPTLLASLLLATLGLARAQPLQPVPALTARVIDQTGTLGAGQKDALEAQLAAFEREAGSQLVVLLVGSTQPEDIAAYANRVANTWRIGRKDIGDGLLIVVAKDDRKVRIEVAKTLEGAVPDLAARQVIDRAITPAFRAGDYAGGLRAAVEQLSARIRGEALPAPRAPTGQGDVPGLQGLGWQELAIFFFVAVPIIGTVLTGMFGRRLGSLVTAAAAGGLGYSLSASLLLAAAAGMGALLLVGLFGIGSAARRTVRGPRGGYRSPPVIIGGSDPYGGGWSGGGGGGFSSGGGGDFGGGGASGGW